MWILIAAVVPPLAFAAVLVLLAALRPRALGLGLPIAGAAVVCFESALVQALSFGQVLSRAGILAGHAGLVLAALSVAARRRRFRWRALVPRPGLPLAMVAVLGLLAAASAVAYLPNTWDSMTYHLARVAHWMQRASVAAYPTNVIRQVGYPPGAEYLLLVVQVLSGSDRLANLVQFGCWLLLAASAPALARAFGAGRRLAPWAAVFVASLPMGVLQASSTQNDVMASLMAVGLTSASLPFLRSVARWRWQDLAILAIAAAGALIVKPTAAVAAFPFCAAAAYSAALSFRTTAARLRHLALGGASAALVLLLVLAPWLAIRGAGPSVDPVVAPYVYLGLGEAGDRVLNVGRGLARHLPMPDAITRALVPSGGVVGCPLAGSLCTDGVLRPREDAAGNPGQVLFVCLALVAAALAWRRLAPRARLGLACVVASWVALQLVFRDNVWAARLQLPAFALAATTLVALGPGSRRRHLGAGIAMAILAAHGGYVALRNEARPVEPGSMATGSSPATYYAAFAGLAPLARAHERALAALGSSGCARLGLYIGEDSYDYPLTWRAMGTGVEVRHLVGPDPWPCLVFSDRGPPPSLADGRAWRATPSRYLFVAP